MNIVNNSCGAVAVFFNAGDNPGIFEKGSNYLLKKFRLYGKECALISEGKKVSLLCDPGLPYEEELMSVTVPARKKNSINSLILKWQNDSLSLMMKEK